MVKNSPSNAGDVGLNPGNSLIHSFNVSKNWAKNLVKTAKKAGAKYITITTRHHDGFSLFDTRGLNNFDAPHSASNRDLIKEFVDECHKEGIVPFFYLNKTDEQRKKKTLAHQILQGLMAILFSLSTVILILDIIGFITNHPMMVFSSIVPEVIVLGEQPTTGLLSNRGSFPEQPVRSLACQNGLQMEPVVLEF